MKKGQIVATAIFSIAAGVVAGLLTAPKSGKESRADIKAKAADLRAKAAKKPKKSNQDD